MDFPGTAVIHNLLLFLAFMAWKIAQITPRRAGDPPH